MSVIGRPRNDSESNSQLNESFTETVFSQTTKQTLQKDMRGRFVNYHYSTDITCQMINPDFPDLLAPPLEPAPKGKVKLKPVYYVSPYATKLDSISRVLFPITYLCFNIMFWIYYSNLSDDKHTAF